MNELVPINYDRETPTVSGRDLHAALEVETPYHKWFPRMREYGFSDNKDYSSFLSHRSGGLPGRQSADHLLTISAAKEICMLQRNGRGKMFRRYFIGSYREIRLQFDLRATSSQSGKKLFLPTVIGKFTKDRVLALETEKLELEETVTVQKEEIAEMKPKARYCDVILSRKDAVSVSVIAKDCGKARRL
jgi:anti-repressor protein